MKTLNLIFVAAVILTSNSVWAWGKRGHQIVGESAAQTASVENGASFLKERGFDFGYYNNVPDMVWKRPSSYEAESYNHFMDLEIFDRAFVKQTEMTAPQIYALSRKDFDKKFPEVSNKAGRAFWRIQEMNTALGEVTEKLRQSSKKLDGKESEAIIEAHKKLQEDWLVLAGTLGHYVADLSQPLHVSENYDGQMTDQKGIHHIFEETYVDELYPQVLVDVLKESAKQWPKFKKSHEKMSVLELLVEEAKDSQKELAGLLSMDKKMDRKNIKKNSEKYRPLIVKRLVAGSLVLAEIYRRNLDWTFLGDKFYFFGSEPLHIAPGVVNSTLKRK